MVEPLRRDDPSRLGWYTLVGRLGEGGMGTVYLAEHPNGQQVAIKVMRPEFAYDTEVRARFRSEVNRAREVPPFSTAAVLDADPEHDPPYVVIEYVDGPSLTAVVREDGLLSGSALHTLAIGIATALSAIHSAGVIHRDLKPGNVLLARGGLKVIDFGIARAFEATSQHTRTDHMVGTVAYMAPERFDADDGRPVTAAADIFAWGAVVTYAATGRTPFSAESPSATAMRILTQPPRLGRLEEPLRSLVAAALSKEPEDRPTAIELINHLVVGTGLPYGPMAVAPPDDPEPLPVAAPELVDPTPTPHRRPRRWTALIAGGTVAVLAATALGLSRRSESPPATGARSAADSAAPAPAGSAAGNLDQPLPGRDRRVLIRVAENKFASGAATGRNLSLPRDAEAVTTSKSTAADASFVLEPSGVDFLIRSLHSDGYPQALKTCLGVKVPEDDNKDTYLAPADCRRSGATVFSLLDTGDKDDRGRPTFHIFNEEFGFVLWDNLSQGVIVQNVGGADPGTTYSFVDRGPAVSGR